MAYSNFRHISEARGWSVRVVFCKVVRQVPCTSAGPASALVEPEPKAPEPTPRRLRGVASSPFDD